MKCAEPQYEHDVPCCCCSGDGRCCCCCFGFLDPPLTSTAATFAPFVGLGTVFCTFELEKEVGEEEEEEEEEEEDFPPMNEHNPNL